ncbi:hypothetical protein NUW58_g472 [Xylaria curta]|uniref:Uncharacterized protein n=1 Tax=Xylaria curta TaxID=42375 RepID=A0ACC1PQH9_9PEZI|nr:hypothetical protein NUW58_g472 [Xylaria curta]
MLSEERIAALRQQVANAIADELIRANINWASFDQLVEPSLCIEAKFQDGLAGEPSAERQPLPGLAISQVIDLTRVAPPRPSLTPRACNSRRTVCQRRAESTSGIIVPSSRGHTPAASRDTVNQTSNNERDRDATNESSDTASDGEDHENGARMAISGLRPSRQDMPIVEDNTQRQMQVRSENFPKRRKAEAIGYAMKPSTLDKLIIGIWEQLHSGASINPVEILGQFTAPPLLRDSIEPSQDNAGLSPSKFRA